jgi:hypothetical protein
MRAATIFHRAMKGQVDAGVVEGLRRSRISEGGFSPRYCILTSIVNCPGPAGFAVQVYGLPAMQGRLAASNSTSRKNDAAVALGWPAHGPQTVEDCRFDMIRPPGHRGASSGSSEQMAAPVITMPDHFVGFHSRAIRCASAI